MSKCRLCKGSTVEVLDLGEMTYTGTFPKPGEDVPTGRLALSLCQGECGLVQIADKFDLTQLYGVNYGYRSGLNKSMLQHLQSTAIRLADVAQLKPNDICIDIGSSDGSLLAAMPRSAILLGVDPSAGKFMSFYPSNINLIVGFFPSDDVVKWRTRYSESPVKIITSIAMFYDLEDPLAFATEVRNLLSPDGIWHIEQSYLGSMLSQKAYDTICHEHIEYYSLKQILYIANKLELKIIHLAKTTTNGGSFEVTLAHAASDYPQAENIESFLAEEQAFKLDDPQTYSDFKNEIDRLKDELLVMLSSLPKKPWGFGASTKGNVLLQYCGLGPENIEAFFDINPNKEGCVTPGTNIPITTTSPPDDVIYLVLPWHFKDDILSRYPNGKFIFPLPEVVKV